MDFSIFFWPALVVLVGFACFFVGGRWEKHVADIAATKKAEGEKQLQDLKDHMTSEVQGLKDHVTAEVAAGKQHAAQVGGSVVQQVSEKLASITG